MIELSFDKMCEMYDRLDEFEFETEGWYPTKKDIETYIMPDPDKHVKFLIWLSENAPAHMSEDEKKVKKIIDKIICDTIYVPDEEEAKF